MICKTVAIFLMLFAGTIGFEGSRFFRGERSRYHERRVIEVIKWRQPVCIMPGKGVHSCLHKLREVLRESQFGHPVGRSLNIEDSASSFLVKSNSNGASKDEDIKMISSKIVHMAPLENLRSSEMEISDQRTKEFAMPTPQLEDSQMLNEEGMHLAMRSEASRIARQIHVTKVLDAPVTATLVAHNCLPDLGIPHCKRHGHHKIELSESSEESKPSLSVSVEMEKPTIEVTKPDSSETMHAVVENVGLEGMKLNADMMPVLSVSVEGEKPTVHIKRAVIEEEETGNYGILSKNNFHEDVGFDGSMANVLLESSLQDPMQDGRLTMEVKKAAADENKFGKFKILQSFKSNVGVKASEAIGEQKLLNDSLKSEKTSTEMKKPVMQEQKPKEPSAGDVASEVSKTSSNEELSPKSEELKVKEEKSAVSQTEPMTIAKQKLLNDSVESKKSSIEMKKPVMQEQKPKEPSAGDVASEVSKTSSNEELSPKSEEVKVKEERSADSQTEPMTTVANEISSSEGEEHKMEKEIPVVPLTQPTSTIVNEEEISTMATNSPSIAQDRMDQPEIVSKETHVSEPRSTENSMFEESVTVTPDVPEQTTELPKEEHPEPRNIDASPENFMVEPRALSSSWSSNIRVSSADVETMDQRSMSDTNGSMENKLNKQAVAQAIHSMVQNKPVEAAMMRALDNLLKRNQTSVSQITSTDLKRAMQSIDINVLQQISAMLKRPENAALIRQKLENYLRKSNIQAMKHSEIVLHPSIANFMKSGATSAELKKAMAAMNTEVSFGVKSSADIPRRKRAASDSSL